jgi:predicted secreted acid phosphatase
MRARTACLATLLLALLVPLLLAPPASADAPDEETWQADVAGVMAGANAWLEERVTTAEPGARLAINLDIDNTSLATYYDRGQPVRKVRSFARLADQLGIAVLFNTGRLKKNLNGVRGRLEQVGYDVSALCTRRPGERLVVGKQRCRQQFVDAGYTLVANVGNHPTDFRGGGYERAFRLPSYDGALG